MDDRAITVIDPLFEFLIPTLSGRASHAPVGFPPHALFRWRVKPHTVPGNFPPEYLSMRLIVVFLPRWRV